MYQWMRAGIQLLYFIFLPSAFTAAFGGVKYIFTQIGQGEPVAWTSFVATLVALCAFTVVFGRFFCGYACAFGALGDALHALYVLICKKCKKKPVRIPVRYNRWLSKIKYVILALIAAMCFDGIYGNMHGTSPWEVFSMVRAGNLKLDGYLIGGILMVLLLVGMTVEERFFCRFFCPMGAVFAMLPVLPFFSLSRNRTNCVKGCSACQKQCPAGIELPDDTAPEVKGECFQCQKCTNICPKGNVHNSMGVLKGNEILLMAGKALILVSILIWCGI